MVISRLVKGLLCLGIVFAVSGAGFAADVWQWNGGDGNWSDFNWTVTYEDGPVDRDPNYPKATGEIAANTWNGGMITVDGDYHILKVEANKYGSILPAYEVPTGTSLDCDESVVLGTDADGGYMLVNGGSVAFDQALSIGGANQLGMTGNGTLEITDGTVIPGIVAWHFLGASRFYTDGCLDGRGNLIMSGGTIDFGSYLHVGKHCSVVNSSDPDTTITGRGYGTITMTGGTMTGYNVWVGEHGAVGVIDLGGTAVLNVDNELSLGKGGADSSLILDGSAIANIKWDGYQLAVGGSQGRDIHQDKNFAMDNKGLIEVNGGTLNLTANPANSNRLFLGEVRTYGTILDSAYGALVATGGTINAENIVVEVGRGAFDTNGNTIIEPNEPKGTGLLSISGDAVVNMEEVMTTPWGLAEGTVKVSGSNANITFGNSLSINPNGKLLYEIDSGGVSTIKLGGGASFSDGSQLQTRVLPEAMMAMSVGDTFDIMYLTGGVTDNRTDPNSVTDLDGFKFSVQLYSEMAGAVKIFPPDPYSYSYRMTCTEVPADFCAALVAGGG